MLSILIEDYERRAHQIGAPTPLEAIEFRMEQAGLLERDLVPFVGSRAKSRRCSREGGSSRFRWSVPWCCRFGIPAEVLIQETRAG